MLAAGASYHQSPPSPSLLPSSPSTSGATGTDTMSTTGLKRKTDDDLASDQRLAKRFHLLNLGKQKHQITAEDIQRVQFELEKNRHKHEEDIPIMETNEASRPRRSRSNAFSDTMNVDESRDRIFIHSIEDELADLSSDEEHPIFIPDIERRLNMLPKTLLRPDQPPRNNNELVLYEVPSSLSIPIERDSARKAIIESRHRAQQQALIGRSESLQNVPSFGVSDLAMETNMEDGDAMDIS